MGGNVHGIRAMSDQRLENARVTAAAMNCQATYSAIIREQFRRSLEVTEADVINVVPFPGSSNVKEVSHMTSVA